MLPFFCSVKEVHKVNTLWKDRICMSGSSSKLLKTNLLNLVFTTEVLVNSVFFIIAPYLHATRRILYMFPRRLP